MICSDIEKDLKKELEEIVKRHDGTLIGIIFLLLFVVNIVLVNVLEIPLVFYMKVNCIFLAKFDIYISWHITNF